jgi:transcriptional regulator with XRE-family HTH domain
METGQRIREARIGKGMTQQELADKTKINVRTIQRIENGEVTARSYTLNILAGALEMDPRLLVNQDLDASTPVKENRSLLVLLHLSGFLLLPTVMIWFFEKDRIKGIRSHGIDVINFQLTMLVFLIPVLPLAFLPILIALFTSAIIIFNTFKVMLNRPYHYPMTISFLR